MKSVMQEASSIAKAFEQAWEKAGKPQQCSVKILEQPRHNFIGMTLQSAKIALFFDEPVASSGNDGRAPKAQPIISNDKQASKPQQSNKPQQVSERPQVQQPVISFKNAGQGQAPKVQQSGISPRNDGQAREPQTLKNVGQEPKQSTVSAGVSPRNDGPRPDYWSEEMISFARNWMKDLLVTMDRSDVNFQVEANKFYLRFSFEKPVYEDEQRERELFRHTSCLLLQTLRNKFKRPLKGYKVVLARA